VTAIEATCVSCGAVWLTPKDIEVRVCVDLRSSAYTFRCPECGLPAAKDADDRVVEFLTTIGASLELWYLPQELREPRPGGDPVSHDDLLDFHYLLQENGWFDRLQQLVAGSDCDVPVRVPPEAPRAGWSPLLKDWRSRSFRRGPRSDPSGR
jgi:hypothetical protein